MSSENRPQDPMRDVTPLLIDVQAHLDRDTPLTSLARQYGYSPFHFHRFFSKAVGETPKRHVDRLRLERAAYKLAVTDATVLEIALSVGFNNHETFSRAFKRAFGYTPRDYRRGCRAAQAEWSTRMGAFRGEGCRLSGVRFVSLPATTLLAIRHHGAYRDLPVPFSASDTLWGDLLAWAKRRGVPHRPIAFLICYDDPTVTPGPLQRVDACIPIDRAATVAGAGGRCRRLDFAGGRYGGIEHAGPLETIDQAYYQAADGIRQSRRYVFDEGPPVQIYRRIHVGGDRSANLTEVYFPVRRRG
jgi:AraC family transcriptional regulator